MNKQTKIIEAIKSEMATRGFSQNKMAKHLGISPGYLSAVMNNSDSISEQLWLQLEARFLDYSWDVYETSNFSAIISMCADSQLYSTSNCISASTGLGKTTALVEYSRTRTNAFYVLSDNMMSTKDFARELQTAVGISQEGTARDMVMAVVRELQKLSRPVLLVDEADKLSDRNLLLLKMIYDRMKNRCGFVTAGTEVLRQKIDKFAKRDKLGYKEWKRRFAVYRALHKFDLSKKKLREEVLGICNDQGITDESQVNYILSAAENYDDVRVMIQDFQREKKRAAAAELKAVETA